VGGNEGESKKRFLGKDTDVIIANDYRKVKQ
jgi:hypothetical protein